MVREVILILALVSIGCGGTPRADRQMEAGRAAVDALTDEGGAADLGDDVAAVMDAAVEVPDAGADADPFQCSTVTPIVLSDPMVISGTVAGGTT